MPAAGFALGDQVQLSASQLEHGWPHSFGESSPALLCQMVMGGTPTTGGALTQLLAWA